MKEALQSPYLKLIFREAFNDEQSVRKNGGTPLNIVFDNGVARFNGSNTSVKYKAIINATCSVRIKFKSFVNVPVGTVTIMDNRADSGAGEIHIINSVISGFATKYINGVVDSTMNSIGSKEVVVCGITIKTPKLSFGELFYTTGNITGDVELIEIYQGTLTASEVANLYKGNWNTELSGMGGGAIGSELSINNNVSSWTVFADATKTDTSYTSVTVGGISFPTVIGKRYRIRLTYSTAAASCALWGGNVVVMIVNLVGGTSLDLTFVATHTNILIRSGNTGTTTFSYVSVQELNPDILLDFDSTGGVIRNRQEGRLLSSNLITNSNFDTSTGWNVPDSWEVIGGKAVATNSSTGISPTPATILTVGSKYILTVDYIRTAGTLYYYNGTTTISMGTTSGRFSFVFTATGTNFLFSGSTFTGSVDNVILYKIQPELVSTAVTATKSGASFNGTTSIIDTGSDFIGTKAVTIMGWFKAYSRGEGNNGTILSNGKVTLYLSSVPPYINFSSNGATTVQANSSYQNINKFLALTRSSTGVVNFYVGDIKTAPALNGSANLASGTPAAGTSNVIIGNNSGATLTFDGIIFKLKIVEGILSLEDITRFWSESLSEIN